MTTMPAAITATAPHGRLSTLATTEPALPDAPIAVLPAL